MSLKTFGKTRSKATLKIKFWRANGCSNFASNKVMLPGVYLHIPFCLSRCSYCDFATDIYRSELAEKYVDALCLEIERFSLKQNIDTIYFGGGTPSLLTPTQIEKILSSVQKKFDVSANAEITMEINPGTVSSEILKQYQQLGINRASFGAQTFDDRELKTLNRRHSAADVRKTIELLRACNFTNVSFDLIAGLPLQTVKGWERNLDAALNLKPEHLSLYLLEIHEGTPLAELIRTGKQPSPNEDLAGEMYELMLQKIATAGYQQYEISNFCLPNFESRHNSKYWTFAPYFGFGCSAHSFDGARLRWENERNSIRYIEMIENKGSAIVKKIELEKDEAAAEFAFLKLRLEEGIDLVEFEERYNFDLQEKYQNELRELGQAELIKLSNNHLQLTQKGKLFSNEVFAIFI
jgi:oxygen-independent coproporphyrinogen-3 oxidase